MTDRIPLDDLNSDQLDQLYDDLDRYEEVVDELNTANTRLARQAARQEAAVTRVTGLYEQWVKAGPPTLGASMARWWDARLAELRGAIRPAAAEAAPLVHIGNGANAEDCPACTGTNPDYPFICAGPDKVEADPELTAEEARDLADELGNDLYRAQDALAFVEECCVILDREGRQPTTAMVREWLKGARCGRELAADPSDTPASTMARLLLGESGKGQQIVPTPDAPAPADLTGYLAPDPPIGCLSLAAEPTPSQRPDLHAQLADAIRTAACDGDCGKAEDECARQHIQPVVSHHGRLAEVSGSPEQFADVALTLLYREWPWLRAAAEDATPPAAT